MFATNFCYSVIAETLERRPTVTRDYRKQAEWRKKNTAYIAVTLNNNTDADIISYIEEKVSKGETKQGVIKRSLRSTMEAEGYKENEEEG